MTDRPNVWPTNHPTRDKSEISIEIFTGWLTEDGLKNKPSRFYHKCLKYSLLKILSLAQCNKFATEWSSNALLHYFVMRLCPLLNRTLPEYANQLLSVPVKVFWKSVNMFWSCETWWLTFLSTLHAITTTFDVLNGQCLHSSTQIFSACCCWWITLNNASDYWANELMDYQP